MTCRLKRKSWLEGGCLGGRPARQRCCSGELNTSRLMLIVFGWISPLYMVEDLHCIWGVYLRHIWLMLFAVLYGDLHCIWFLNVPSTPFNSLQSCHPPFVIPLEKVLSWNSSKFIKTYGSCKDEWQMNGSLISCRRFYLRHTPTHLKTSVASFQRIWILGKVCKKKRLLLKNVNKQWL